MQRSRRPGHPPGASGQVPAARGHPRWPPVGRLRPDSRTVRSRGPQPGYVGAAQASRQGEQGQLGVRRDRLRRPHGPQHVEVPRRPTRREPACRPASATRWRSPSAATRSSRTPARARTGPHPCTGRAASPAGRRGRAPGPEPWAPAPGTARPSVDCWRSPSPGATAGPTPLRTAQVRWRRRTRRDRPRRQAGPALNFVVTVALG